MRESGTNRDGVESKAHKTVEASRDESNTGLSSNLSEDLAYSAMSEQGTMEEIIKTYA